MIRVYDNILLGVRYNTLKHDYGTDKHTVSDSSWRHNNNIFFSRQFHHVRLRREEMRRSALVIQRYARGWLLRMRMRRVMEKVKDLMAGLLVCNFHSAIFQNIYEMITLVAVLFHLPL